MRVDRCLSPDCPQETTCLHFGFVRQLYADYCLEYFGAWQLVESANFTPSKGIMFSVSNLQFSYGGDTAFSFPDIALAEGEHVLLLGRSGIGKTTLLHLMAGLLKPSAGNVVLNGTNVHALSSRALDRFRGQNIGLVFQKPQFVRSLTVFENLLLLQHLAGAGKNIARAEAVLSELNMLEKRNRKPHTLSEGEQQRIAIAMAVLNQPGLLLADEPTASLDDQNCERVLELLQAEAQKANAHLIIITHDQRVRAAFNRTITL